MGYINIFHLFLIMCLGLFLLNRNEIALVLLLTFNTVGGLMVSLFPFPLPGSVITFILAILILNKRIPRIISFCVKKSFVYIFVLLGLFTFYYLFSDYGEHATKKIINIYINTLIYSLAYLNLVNNDDIDCKNISLYFVLAAIFQIAFAYNVYGYHFSGVFDFDNFRLMTIHAVDNGYSYMSYHMPALYSVIAFAFYISNKKNLKLGMDVVFILTTFWIVLVAGARQGVLSYILVFILWLYVKNKSIKLSNIIVVGISGLFFYVLLTNLEVDFIQRMFDSRGNIADNINRNIDYPMELVKNVPIFGIGFGNYLNPYTFETYPHNIFLEIIIEMGFLGLISIFGLVVVYCKKNKFSIYHQLSSGVYAIIIVMPYLLHAIISDDLGSNVVCFILLFIMFVKVDKNISVVINKNQK